MVSFNTPPFAVTTGNVTPTNETKSPMSGSLEVVSGTNTIKQMNILCAVRYVVACSEEARTHWIHFLDVRRCNREPIVLE